MPKEKSYIDILTQVSTHKLNTYLKQVPTWTGFVQSLLSFGLSELPINGNRSKQTKFPEKQHTSGREGTDL